MEVQDYIAVLRKRWLSILLVTLLTTGGAVAATFMTTPTYTAASQVFVSVRTGSTSSDLLQGSSFTQKQVKSYTDLVTTPRVLIPVIENLDIATTPDELAKSITATSPLDTVLITITATHEDAQTAADLANATAVSLATEVTALEKPEDGPSPVEISTVRTASAPVAPSAPNTRLNVALGLLVGLAAGFGIAVARQVLDTRIRSENDVRQVTDASVIATITHDDEAAKTPLIVQASPQSHRAEAFRRLRTNLQFLDVADDLQTLVVTSSLPGEGKSTTTINLAITLADAGSRVVLVDADLRRPTVAKYMGIEGSVGLTTVLIGRAEVEDVLQPWGEGTLHVLPSGLVPPNPSELLGSRAMADLLARLSQQYDVVLIDTPPLLPVTDAAILARLTGGALVVVGATKTHRQQLDDSLGALETVGARVLGIVLNRVPVKEAGSYTYYDYTPHDGAAAAGRKRAPRGSRASSRASSKASSRAGSAAGTQPTGRAVTGTRQPVRTTTRRLDPTHVEAPVESLLGSAEAASAGGRWPGAPLGSDRS